MQFPENVPSVLIFENEDQYGGIFIWNLFWSMIWQFRIEKTD